MDKSITLNNNQHAVRNARKRTGSNAPVPVVGGVLRATKAKDWRKSKKANELRSFIDTVFQSRKGSIYAMDGLDRELIIDFVAKEVENAKKV